MIIAIILNTLCMGAYQSFVNIFICCSICSYLMIAKESKWNLKDAFIIILKYILVFIISLLLSQIIGKIFAHLFIHDNAAATYLSSKILWGTKSISIVLNELFSSIKFILKGEGILNLPYYLIITIITIIYTTYKMFKHKLDFITEYIPIIFLIISPFLVSILLGHSSAYRALLGFPIVLGFLFFYLINDNKKSYLSKFLVVLGIITCIHQGLISTKLFINDYKRYQNDVSLAKRINNSLKKYDTKKPVVFLGIKSSLEYFDERDIGEVMGHSFFEWDSGSVIESNKRINQFLQILNYKYKLPTKKEYNDANKYRRKLKSYPNKNSIKETDKYIIVKLSD